MSASDDFAAVLERFLPGETMGSPQTPGHGTTNNPTSRFAAEADSLLLGSSPADGSSDAGDMIVSTAGLQHEMRREDLKPLARHVATAVHDLVEDSARERLVTRRKLEESRIQGLVSHHAKQLEAERAAVAAATSAAKAWQARYEAQRGSDDEQRRRDAAQLLARVRLADSRVESTRAELKAEQSRSATALRSAVEARAGTLRRALEHGLGRLEVLALTALNTATDRQRTKETQLAHRIILKTTTVNSVTKRRKHVVCLAAVGRLIEAFQRSEKQRVAALLAERDAEHVAVLREALHAESRRCKAACTRAFSRQQQVSPSAIAGDLSWIGDYGAALHRSETRRSELESLFDEAQSALDEKTRETLKLVSELSALETERGLAVQRTSMELSALGAKASEAQTSALETELALADCRRELSSVAERGVKERRLVETERDDLLRQLDVERGEQKEARDLERRRLEEMAATMERSRAEATREAGEEVQALKRSREESGRQMAAAVEKAEGEVLSLKKRLQVAERTCQSDREENERLASVAVQKATREAEEEVLALKKRLKVAERSRQSDREEMSAAVQKTSKQAEEEVQALKKRLQVAERSRQSDREEHERQMSAVVQRTTQQAEQEVQALKKKLQVAERSRESDKEDHAALKKRVQVAERGRQSDKEESERRIHTAVETASEQVLALKVRLEEAAEQSLQFGEAENARLRGAEVESLRREASLSRAKETAELREKLRRVAETAEALEAAKAGYGRREAELKEAEEAVRIELEAAKKQSERLLEQRDSLHAEALARVEKQKEDAVALLRRQVDAARDLALAELRPQVEEQLRLALSANDTAHAKTLQSEAAEQARLHRAQVDKATLDATRAAQAADRRCETTRLALDRSEQRHREELDALRKSTRLAVEEAATKHRTEVLEPLVKHLEEVKRERDASQAKSHRVNEEVASLTAQVEDLRHQFAKAQEDALSLKHKLHAADLRESTVAAAARAAHRSVLPKKNNNGRSSSSSSSKS